MCNKVLHLLWACHTLKTKKTQLEKIRNMWNFSTPVGFFIWVAVFVCLFLLGYAEKVSTYLSCGVGFRGEWKQVILCQAFDMWHKSRKTIVNECRVFCECGVRISPENCVNREWKIISACQDVKDQAISQEFRKCLSLKYYPVGFCLSHIYINVNTRWQKSLN